MINGSLCSLISHVAAELCMPCQAVVVTAVQHIVDTGDGVVMRMYSVHNIVEVSLLACLLAYGQLKNDVY